MACELSLREDQLCELKEVFSIFDLDRDGKVTRSQLASLLQFLDIKPNEDQLNALLRSKEIDKNNTQLIEFGEFTSLIAAKLGEEVSHNQKNGLQLFGRLDRDGIGFITAIDLVGSLAKLGRSLSFRELADMIREANTDGDGRISYGDFAAATDNQKKILALFRAFDRDGNGFITAVELVHSMARLGYVLSLRELANMIKEADTDGDGRISFPEFYAAIHSRSLHKL